MYVSISMCNMPLCLCKYFSTLFYNCFILTLFINKFVYWLVTAQSSVKQFSCNKLASENCYLWHEDIKAKRAYCCFCFFCYIYLLSNFKFTEFYFKHGIKCSCKFCTDVICEAILDQISFRLYFCNKNKLTS